MLTIKKIDANIAKIYQFYLIETKIKKQKLL